MVEATSPNLDIIVIAHGHQELTMRCVKTVFAHTNTPFHLIVVDDSSSDMDDNTDMTPEWFNKFCAAHPNVTFVHSDAPFKNSFEVFDTAFNYCKTSYAAVVVNSMLVEPEWELVGLQLMKSIPDAGVIGFKCLRLGTELIESAGLATVANGGSVTDIGRGQAGHRFSKVYECDVVQWAFVLLRLEAVKDNLGEAVYNGFKGCEEFETCFTVREKGWKIYYSGLGVGYHQTLATRVAKNEKDIELNAQNKEIFHKRWGYWEQYHKYSGFPEFFPEMLARPRVLSPVLLCDVTGVLSQRVERMYKETKGE